MNLVQYDRTSFFPLDVKLLGQQPKGHNEGSAQGNVGQGTRLLYRRRHADRMGPRQEIPTAGRIKLMSAHAPAA